MSLGCAGLIDSIKDNAFIPRDLGPRKCDPRRLLAGYSPATCWFLLCVVPYKVLRILQWNEDLPRMAASGPILGRLGTNLDQLGTPEWRLCHEKVIRMTAFSAESHQNDDFFTKTSSEWRLFHENVIRMTTCSRKRRQNDDFVTRRSSEWQLFHQKVIRMTTLSRKRHQNDDFFMKGSSELRFFHEKSK